MALKGEQELSQLLGEGQHCSEAGLSTLAYL